MKILTSVPSLLSLVFLLFFGNDTAAQPDVPLADTTARPGTEKNPIVNVGQQTATHHYTDGGLRPVIGTHTYQAFRANRDRPEKAGDPGFTYNHQAYLAYWNEKYYLQWLSGPVNELDADNLTLIKTSEDGIHWDDSRVAFPQYQLADGRRTSVHQRMGFYITPDDRLLTFTFYGLSDEKNDGKKPNDGSGVGRVVREVYKDGGMGPIYFIRYNRHAGFDESNTKFPFYKKSPDQSFVKACDEVLANKLVTFQWWEEDRSEDGYYPEKESWKSLSSFHRKDGTTVGLWKHSLAAISKDDGKSWSPMVKIPSIEMAGTKIWGQATKDGRYILSYNPREVWHRYPLALLSSDDGMVFDNLLSVNGEVPVVRYRGEHKGIGPQYVRGISEWNGTPPGENFWLTYSQNKEDIWVSRMPVPIRQTVTEDIDDDFEKYQTNSFVGDWNIYSPMYAPVAVTYAPDGSGNTNKCLRLADRDPYDFAKAVRVFRSSERTDISLDVYCAPGSAWLEISVLDHEGKTAAKVGFDQHGEVIGYKPGGFFAGDYEQGSWHNVRLAVNAGSSNFDLYLDDKLLRKGIKSPEKVAAVERLSIVTGEDRTKVLDPNPPFHFGPDVSSASELEKSENVFYIDNVKIK